MNKLSLLVAGLLGAATLSVQAGELYSPQQFQDAPSGLTRAQVKQAVLAERRNGELDHNDVDLPGDGVSAGNADAFGRTRASVKAETLAAAKAGGLAHDDVDLPTVATGSVLSRQSVRNEAVAARPVTVAPGRVSSEF